MTFWKIYGNSMPSRNKINRNEVDYFVSILDIMDLFLTVILLLNGILTTNVS